MCLPPSLHPNSLDRPSVRPTRDSAHLKPAGGRRRRRKRAKRKRGGGGEGGRKVGVEKLLGGKKCNGVIHRTMNLEGVGGKKRREERKEGRWSSCSSSEMFRHWNRASCSFPRASVRSARARRKSPLLTDPCCYKTCSAGIPPKSNLQRDSSSLWMERAIEISDGGRFSPKAASPFLFRRRRSV